MDFSSFQCVIFRCKWWDTFDRNNVKEDRDSRLICINSRKMWDEAKEPYVFPKHCNQVFFTQMSLIGIGGLYWDMTLDQNTFFRTIIMRRKLEDNEGDHEN